MAAIFDVFDADRNVFYRLWRLFDFVNAHLAARAMLELLQRV
jgi:hypothetical protein